MDPGYVGCWDLRETKGNLCGLPKGLPQIQALPLTGWKWFEILESILPLVRPSRGILFLLNFASDLDDNSHAKFLASWAETWLKEAAVVNLKTDPFVAVFSGFASMPLFISVCFPFKKIR